MSTVLRPVGHEDKLSLVEHLDELRTRIIASLVVFLACFAVCFWQNEAILDVMNRPLEQTAHKSGSQDPFELQATLQQKNKTAAQRQAAADRARAAAADTAAERRAQLAAAEAWEDVAASTPRTTPRRPITTGVGEPFFTTLKVSAYAALLISLPFLLWQLYAFVLPAFSPQERRVAVPLMSMVPFLFIAGAAFAYFVVLPNAVDFLQNFNDDQFDILLQARDYYSFSILVMVALGAMFQIPVGVLLLTRAEIVSVRQLRAARRYAIVIMAVLAMLLPGTDPVTMLLSLAPLVVLYEGSILLAALLDRRAARATDDDQLPILSSDADD